MLDALRRRSGGRDDSAACAAVLDATARSLRAGMSLGAGLDAARASCDMPTALADALVHHERGQPLARVLDDAHAGVGDDRHADDPGAVHVLLTVLTVAAEHGGATAEALDRTAATLRERSALAAEARVHASSARLSAVVLTAVPLAFSGFAVVADARVRAVLLTSPTGWLCVLVGLALNLAGRRWMTRIVRSVSAPTRWT